MQPYTRHVPRLKRESPTATAMTIMAGVEKDGLCSSVVSVLIAVSDENKYEETDARVVGGERV
jgi:hypothetical protein